MRGLSLEELWQVIAGYAEAFTYALGIWLPGAWALVGALVLPPVAALCFRLFPNRYAKLRLCLSPFAGGFAGGYFEALALRAESCAKFKGLLCIIAAPAAELALIILASMLSVVFVYLSLPGRKIPRHFDRPDYDFEASD